MGRLSCLGNACSCDLKIALVSTNAASRFNSDAAIGFQSSITAPCCVCCCDVASLLLGFRWWIYVFEPFSYCVTNSM